MNGITLAVSKRCVKEIPEVTSAWIRAGGRIKVVDRFWTKQGVVSAETRLYGNGPFCETVAEASRLSLISPRDELLTELGKKWTRRKVEESAVSDITDDLFFNRGTIFVKPVEPKIFAASVFESSAEFQAITKGLPSSTRVLVSEVVNFQNEARAFIVDGEIADCNFYIKDGDLSEAAKFVSSFVAEHIQDLPSTFVVDIGEVEDGWAVIEFNSTWASHPRQCNPNLILPCIAAGTLGR